MFAKFIARSAYILRLNWLTSAVDHFHDGWFSASLVSVASIVLSHTRCTYVQWDCSESDKHLSECSFSIIHRKLNFCRALEQSVTCVGVGENWTWLTFVWAVADCSRPATKPYSRACSLVAELRDFFVCLSFCWPVNSRSVHNAGLILLNLCSNILQYVFVVLFTDQPCQYFIKELESVKLLVLMTAVKSDTDIYWNHWPSRWCSFSYTDVYIRVLQCDLSYWFFSVKL